MTGIGATAPPDVPRRSRGLLALAIVVTAIATIVYELVIGALSAYLHGDSALQYSLTIGTFLAALGCGAFLARDVPEPVLQRLLNIELGVALLGGVSALVLYSANALAAAAYLPIMVGLAASIGVLAGMELPLLAVLLERAGGLRAAFASALSLDYLGSLFGALLFPFVLLPLFGTVNTALLTGLVNLAAVGLLASTAATPVPRGTWIAGLGIGALLLGALALSDRLVSQFEHRLYSDEVIAAETTRFQRLVVTRYRDDVRLYSDGELQFSSRDEARYHEALVHPLLAQVRHPESVLVIGGGDGLAVRELLRDQRVRRITLVDVDPRMTELARTLPALTAINRHALHDSRVRLVHADGYRFASDAEQRFDAIVVDLPDPKSDVLARLYSKEFYDRLRDLLSPTGALVVQATSPYYTRASFWTIETTLRASGLSTVPYRIYVPSFGEWGFVLASRARIDWSRLRLRLPRRYLDDATLQAAIAFDTDTARLANLPVSTFAAPHVWRHYRRSVRYWRD